MAEVRLGASNPVSTLLYKNILRTARINPVTRYDTLRDMQLVSSLLLAFLIAGLGSPLESTGAERPAPSRPNILVIISEDNGQELGCYGNPHVKTPVLNGLASEGVRFQHGEVPGDRLSIP